jgi:hypothetical protein
VIFLAANHPKQKIDLNVNGRNVGTWQFQGDRPKTVEISFVSPEPLGEYGSMDMQFRVSSPVSPKELGLSDDRRRLGLALQAMEAEAY